MQYLTMLLALSTSTSNLLYTILFTLLLFFTMRKIEQSMNTAIRNRINWSGGNTAVIVDSKNADLVEVFLHGNRIAQVCSEFVAIFDGGWQSNTTKSRLNALCNEFRPQAGVFQKDWTWFIRHGNSVFPFISGSLI